MQKIILAVLVSIQVICSEELLLSDLKQSLLEIKREKAINDTLLEENSWISSMSLSATFQKSKDATDIESENKNVGISWSQDIFRSGGIEASIDKARADGMVNLLDVDMEQASYLKEGYGYLCAVKRDMLVLKQNMLTLKNSEIDLEIIKKEYEVGNRDITDLNRAILDRDSAHTALITAKNTLQSEMLELEKIIGDRDLSKLHIPDFPLITKNEYLNRHLQLRQYDAQVQSNSASYEMTKSSYLPKLTLNTALEYNDYKGNQIGYNGRSYSYGVTASIPIDYNTKETLQSSKLQLLQSKAEKEDQKAELRKSYRTALGNIDAYRQKIKIAEEMKQMYEKLYTLTKAQVRSGVKSDYDRESLENSMKIQRLEVEVQSYNVLIEKMKLYFDVEPQKGR